jgi:hypothetical protein
VTALAGRGLGAAVLLAALLVAAPAVPVGARPSVAGAASAASAASPASAATNGACPTAAGVTVIVDFQHLTTESGGTPASIVRCATEPPSSGFDALTKAGIQWQRLQNGDFVCRIEGLPHQPGYAGGCAQYPPTNAYWSYWVAPRGGAWCYSQIGAASRTPKAGTVEGWSFSSSRSEGGTPPRVAVPGAVAGAPVSVDGASCPHPPPPPTTTTTAKPGPATTAPPAGGGTTGGTTGGSTGASTTAPTQRRGGPTGTAPAATDPTGALVPDAAPSSTGEPDRSSTSSSSTAAAVGEVRIRDDEGGGGSPAGAIAAGSVVGGLALAAALTARRRRRAGTTEPGW